MRGMRRGEGRKGEGPSPTKYFDLEPTLGPDLQNILRQSYDYLTIMPKLRSTYDGRLIYKTSYEGRKAFLGYDSLAEL